MQKYTTLLFDLDDTLLDFQAAEQQAFRLLCEEVSLPYSEKGYLRYQQINQSLWQKFELGKISKTELLGARFVQFFGEFGFAVQPEIDRQYRHYLGEGHQEIPFASELLADLSTRYRIFAVTNGVHETQAKRLKASSLLPYFDGVYVSEKVGWQKPQPEFFDRVFEDIGVVIPEETLIIGDSLTSDIKGGLNAGIDSCWYNPHLLPSKSQIRPTYTISDLMELYEVLGEESPLAETVGK